MEIVVAITTITHKQLLFDLSLQKSPLDLWSFWPLGRDGHFVLSMLGWLSVMAANDMAQGLTAGH